MAPAPSSMAEAEPIQPVRPRPARRTAGRADLVVVFSGKGGVGKSLIATNLAVALAGDGSRVALVDLDLQFGDVGVMLHTEGHPTAINSLAQQGEQVEAEFIEEVMATGPAGVRALLAPASPEFADLVNTANVRAILRELAKGYDHVVVDTPAHLEERNLEAFEMAEQIIVVSSYSLASIKDTKVTLKLLQSLGIAKERLCVVLNQTNAKVGFPRSEVEENLLPRGHCATFRSQGGRVHRQRAPIHPQRAEVGAEQAVPGPRRSHPGSIRRGAHRAGAKSGENQSAPLLAGARLRWRSAPIPTRLPSPRFGC